MPTYAEYLTIWVRILKNRSRKGGNKLASSKAFRTQVKMGRPMSEELDRMGDKDGEVRARMWATLAAQSDDAFERLTAHQRAIDALEDTPWMQVGRDIIGFVEYLAFRFRMDVDAKF